MGGWYFEGLYTHKKDGRHHSSTLEGGMEHGYKAITVCSCDTDGLHEENFVNFTSIYTNKNV